MEGTLPLTVEPKQRDELPLKFIAGPGTYTQTLTFFVEANNALYQRQIDLVGTTAAAPAVDKE